jgi:hypothetical protein
MTDKNKKVDRKNKEVIPTIDVSLPQDIVSGKKVKVKEVFNSDFSKEGVSRLSSLYKSTNKEDNSKEFYDLAETFEKAFHLEQDQIKKEKRNHPVERATINKKIRGLLPLKKKDDSGKPLPMKSFENKFSRASMLGEILFLGTAQIKIEDNKGKKQMTANWSEIQPTITIKEGGLTNEIPTPTDRRINLSFEQMEKTHREKIRGIFKDKDTGKGGSTVSNPLEGFISFMIAHNGDNYKMETLARKIKSTDWSSKDVNVDGLIDNGEFLDISKTFNENISRAFDKVEKEDEEQDTPTKGPVGLSKKLAIGGVRA